MHSLITRQETKEHLLKAYPLLQKDYLTKTIQDIPEAKTEQKKGKWKEDTITFDIYCTACNHRAVVKWDFCPWCGADMREDQDE